MQAVYRGRAVDGSFWLPLALPPGKMWKVVHRLPKIPSLESLGSLGKNVSVLHHRTRLRASYPGLNYRSCSPLCSQRGASLGQESRWIQLAKRTHES